MGGGQPEATSMNVAFSYKFNGANASNTNTVVNITTKDGKKVIVYTSQQSPGVGQGQTITVQYGSHKNGFVQLDKSKYEVSLESVGTSKRTKITIEVDGITDKTLAITQSIYRNV